MTTLELSLLISCIFLSLTALILACTAISIVVGFKTSTHKVEWLSYDPEAKEVQKLQSKKPTDEIDLDDPFISSNI